jgi:hypothetical protein
MGSHAGPKEYSTQKSEPVFTVKWTSFTWSNLNVSYCLMAKYQCLISDSLLLSCCKRVRMWHVGVSRKWLPCLLKNHRKISLIPGKWQDRWIQTRQTCSGEFTCLLRAYARAVRWGVQLTTNLLRTWLKFSWSKEHEPYLLPIARWKSTSIFRRTWNWTNLSNVRIPQIHPIHPKTVNKNNPGSTCRFFCTLKMSEVWMDQEAFMATILGPKIFRKFLARSRSGPYVWCLIFCNSLHEKLNGLKMVLVNGKGV